MTCNALHSKQQPSDGIHGVVAWVYADSIARLAATGFVETDLYKLAYQSSTSSLFVLQDYNPITWSELAVSSSSSLLNKVEVLVANESGETLLRGKAVFASGSNNDDKYIVELADKDDPDRRPALGIIFEDILDGGDGIVLVVGNFEDFDTSAWELSDQLVLGNNGELSRPPPDIDPFTGEIQPIGIVSKVDVSDGHIFINSNGLLAVTATQVFALAGTNGTPSKANPYVTDSDARNTNARTPTTHATSHKSGGSDPIKLDELDIPTDVTTLNATTERHGLLLKLGGGTANFLRADGSWSYAEGAHQQCITVAKAGGQFTTIQGAIDSVSDASAEKQYVIQVFAGIYVENVVIADYISVVGVESSTCIISPLTGTAVTFEGSGPGTGTLKSMTINVEYGVLTAATAALKCTGGSNSIIDCFINVSSTGGNFPCKAIEFTGGVLLISTSLVRYARAGGTGSLTQRVIDADFPGFSFSYTRIEITQTSGNDEIYGFYISANGTGTSISDNTISIINASGNTIGVYSAVNLLSLFNLEFLISASGDATGVEVFGSSSVVVSKQCIWDINGVSNSYLANVADTCTFKSLLNVSSDSLTSTGSGIYVVINAEDENFKVTQNITDGTNSLTVANAKTAFDHVSNTSNPHSVTADQVGAVALTSSAPADVTKDTSAVGVGTTAARADHKHDITTAIVSAQVPGDSASEGSATSVARSDHKHSLPAYGSSVSTICQGNDSRLSDSRTPTAHATSHKSGGSDPIKLDELDTPTDVTTLNATLTEHGLLPKLGGGTTNYLRADGSWANPVVAIVFGANYATAISVASSSTASATFQNKVQMIIPALTGTFRIGWQAMVRESSKTTTMEVRLYNVTDTVVLSPGTTNLTPSAASNTINVGGFQEIVLVGAPKTVQIQYRAVSGTAYIEHARIEFWQIS